MNVLSDLFRSGVATRHGNFFRVVQQLFSQTFNIVREGRGEQQVLATSRQFCQHATDIVDKAHVQHAVSFIQYQDFYLVEFNCVLVF
ncbi:hypothetical protein D3C75_616850 [compost metagenome]